MIYQQSVFEPWPTGSESVQAIICSPPYYALRRYSIPDIQIGDWKGQYGLEESPSLYIEHTRLWAKEAWRVLKNDGIFFLNLADSYSTKSGGMNQMANKGIENMPQYGAIPYKYEGVRQTKGKGNGCPSKCQLLIPHRVAIALVDDGWTLRNTIVWCLSGGVYLYVKTQKGEMPMMIRDMARLKPETVKLWNGEKWTRVLGWSKSKRQNTEIEIVLRSGERISCTPKHQFPTKRGLLKAEELKNGDLLEVSLLPEPENPLLPSLVPDEIGWFVGLYLAEGSKSNDCIQISGHIKEGERFERLSKIVSCYGGTIKKYNTIGCSQTINIHSKVLNSILAEYISGKTAKDKGLSVKCWQRNNTFLLEVLYGYLYGDGHWDNKNNRWRLGFTRNYNLERDLRVMCARLAFHLVLKLSNAKLNGKKFPCFRGEIRFTKTHHRNCKHANEIIEIRKARCREVYDIGVEDEPHLFALASGILTHNCKPNAMPESVTDRFSKKYEYIFMFTKQEKYYFDLDSILELYAESSLKRYSLAQSRNLESVSIIKGFDSGCNDTNENYPQIYKTGQGSVKARGNNKDSLVVGGNNNGKNPGDVWVIPTSPSSEKISQCGQND